MGDWHREWLKKLPACSRSRLFAISHAPSFTQLLTRGDRSATGLVSAVELLQPIKDKVTHARSFCLVHCCALMPFCCLATIQQPCNNTAMPSRFLWTSQVPNVSWADLMQLASALSIEVILPTVMHFFRTFDLSFNLSFSLFICSAKGLP